MHLNIKYISGKIAGALLILSAVVACHPQKEVKGISQKKDKKVALTKVASLHPERQVVLPGELKPWNRVDITAKVRGYVGNVNVDRGTKVKKGQVLAVLEAPEVVAALGNAKANVSAAESRLIEAKAKYNASKLTYSRMFETSQTEGAVSKNELDLANSKMMADSALTSSAQGALEAAAAQLASQQQLVDYLTIKAPFDGVIIDRNISPGALVGSANNGGLPVFVLEDQQKLRLTLAIPETMANSIPENGKATFSVTADPGTEFEAVYARSANSLQEVNRSMLTEFDVDNSDGRLKAGMYADVSLPISRNESTLFVPTSSVVTSSEGVYVIRVKGEVANWVNVKKGSLLDSLVEVFGPIKEGDFIVKNADPELRDGMSVSD